MNDYSKIEKEMYSKDKGAHVETQPEAFEKFADHVAKSYHKQRQKEWQKFYRQNYKSKFAKEKEKALIDYGIK